MYKVMVGPRVFGVYDTMIDANEIADILHAIYKEQNIEVKVERCRKVVLGD